MATNTDYKPTKISGYAAKMRAERKFKIPKCVRGGDGSIGHTRWSASPFVSFLKFMRHCVQFVPSLGFKNLSISSSPHQKCGGGLWTFPARGGTLKNNGKI